MKKLLSLFLLVLSAYTTLAQVSTSYTWQRTTTTWQYVSSAATQLDAGKYMWGATYPNQNIGFAFPFNGNNYTSLGVSCNGFVWLGNTFALSMEQTPISSTFNTDGMISIFGRELRGISDSASIRTELTGISPNRVFTIQWKRVCVSTSAGDYQIKLHEGGDISFHYNLQVYTQFSVHEGQVGLRGYSNADFINRSIVCDSASNWDTNNSLNPGESVSGTVNTATCKVDGQHLCNLYPATGTTYYWEYSPTSVGARHINAKAGNLFTINGNAANGTFSLTLKQPVNNAQVKIFNTLGQVVSAEPVNGGAVVPVSISGKGIYFVQLTTASGSQLEKVIVQ